MAHLSTSTLKICGDGHANAIAVNKDYNHCAIAGRSCKFFAFFSIIFFVILNYVFLSTENLFDRARRIY